MTQHELEFHISSANCDNTPVDQHVQSLVSAGTNNSWEFCPNGPGGLPCFQFDDTQRKLHTTLVCEAATKDYSQYCLEAKSYEGVTEMRSVEWVAAGNPCPLQALYDTLVDAMQDATNGVTESEGVDPEADVSLINDFIDALILDAQGGRQKVHFIRKGNGFFSDSFGISESTISLVKEWEDDESTRLFIKMTKPDGTLVLSCGETSRHTDDEAELRKLYRLLDEKVPIVTIDIATHDVRRFVEGCSFDTFFDRVLKYAQPELPAIESDDVEGKVLIRDLFNNVGEASVIRQFLDEVALRKGPLSEPRYKQLKALAQSVFTIIRNTQREPNGRVFTTQAVAVAFDKPGLASRGVKWSSNLYRIANSYTTWGFELVGQDPATGEGCTLHKLAVLTLAAILADHIQ